MVSFIWKGINIEENVGAVQFAWIIFLLTALTGNPHRRPLLLAGHLRRRHILPGLRHRFLRRDIRTQGARQLHWLPCSVSVIDWSEKWAPFAFLVDAATLAIVTNVANVTNVAYCLTTNYVLPHFDQITGVSPTQMSHMSFAGPTAILLALKALYGGGRWLRRYPLLFLAVPMPSFVGAILEIGLLQFVLPNLSIVEHTVGFLVGLMMSYVLPHP
ncbi:hypothetical protein MTO96_004634 [Rhipicephalus appendiculatus]